MRRHYARHSIHSAALIHQQHSTGLQQRVQTVKNLNTYAATKTTIAPNIMRPSARTYAPCPCLCIGFKIVDNTGSIVPYRGVAEVRVVENDPLPAFHRLQQGTVHPLKATRRSGLSGQSNVPIARAVPNTRNTSMSVHTCAGTSRQLRVADATTCTTGLCEAF